MKLDRFDVTIWGMLGAFSLALAAMLVGNDLIGARVARTFPADNDVVDESGRIGLEFTEPMQPQAVEPLLSITPFVLGTWRWEGRQIWFTPETPFNPHETYTVQLKAGATSDTGQAMKLGVSWKFRGRAPWIVYMAPAAGQLRQLWRISSAGGEPQALTEADFPVQDFAVAPDGTQIVVSRQNDQRGFNLWLIAGDGQNARLLVDCQDGICGQPAWSPDGKRVAFNRHAPGLSPGELGPPRVWIVEMDTGETAPLYPDAQTIGANPSWSPDGRRIATQGWLTGDIRILDLQTNSEILLFSQLFTQGSWSPDGHQMLLNDLVMQDDDFQVALEKIDFQTGLTTTIVSEAPAAGTTTPAWSPTGEWWAFGRRLGDGSLGRQLWLSRPDGSDARAITNDPRYSFDNYHWDPWGQALVFQRFELNVPNATPAIVMWSFTTGETKVLVENAILPIWQP